MTTLQRATFPREPHLRLVNQTCPTCEQPIPNDRITQVKARLAARERELVNTAVSAERTKWQAEKETAIRSLTAQMQTKELAARAAGKKEAEAAMKDQLATAQQRAVLADQEKQRVA